MGDSYFRDDVYTGRQVIHADIRFEQACILYNIGALHSVLGAMDNRQTPEVKLDFDCVFGHFFLP